MADLPNFNTQQPLPQLQPQSSSAAAMQGMVQQAGIQSQQAYQQAQQVNQQKAQLDMQAQKANMMFNIASGVMMQPEDQKPAAYAQAIKTAQMYGLDTSKMPQNWGDDANAFVSSSYYSSGRALQMMKAQAEIQAQQAMTGKNASIANKNAYDMGQPQPFPSLGAGQQQAPGQGGQGMQPQPGQMNQSGQQGGIINPMSGHPDTMPKELEPYLSSSQPLPGPAGIQAQKDQATQWMDFKNQQAQSAAASRDSLTYLNDAKEQINRLGDMGQGPVAGKLTGNLPAGIQLGKDSANLQLAVLKSLRGIGNRVMNAEFSTLNKATPNVDNNKDTNLSIINKQQTLLKLSQLESQATPMLEKYGIRDPQTASNLLDKVYNGLNLQDKKGEMDPAKLDDYWNQFSKVTGIKLGSDQYQRADGKVISSADIQKAAGMHLMSPADVINQDKLQPVQNQQQSGVPVPVQQRLSQLSAPTMPLAASIAKVETGGVKNPYSQVTSVGDGRVALGKYQILASNIKQWSKDVLGQSITPRQYLQSPQIQDIIAHVKIDDMYKKYGNPQDVASMWLSGKPLKGNNAADVKTGITVPRYVQNVMRNMNQFANNTPTLGQ